MIGLSIWSKKNELNDVKTVQFFVLLFLNVDIKLFLFIYAQKGLVLQEL